MMEADKHEQELLVKALDEWQTSGLITDEQAQRLKASIASRKSERQQLAQYFFIVAVICALLAFGALFINEKLLARLQKIFLLRNLTISVVSAILSAVCYWQARKQRIKVDPGTYELYLIPGTIAALVSLVYLCKDIGNGASYSLFLGLSTLLLISLSIGFRSRLIWMGFLAAAMGWYGAFSSALSHDNLFLGMNYPVRFTMFGLVVLTLSFLVKSVARLSKNFKITYQAGLIIFYTGLWGVSVFGNYGHLDEWHAVRQTQVIGYGILFGVITAIGLFVGIRKNDAAARDYSILFLLLNLYTRYFEYFWDNMNKGLFFLFLAVSFGLVGYWLNKSRQSKKETVADT